MFSKVNLKELHIIFSCKSLKLNKCLGIPAAVEFRRHSMSIADMES